MSRWQRFVRRMDREESASALALIRIMVGAVLFADFAWAGSLGLVERLWGSSGLNLSYQSEHPSLAIDLLGENAGQVLWALALTLALTTTLGLFSRVSAASLALVSAQLAAIMPQSDRGIDGLLRIVLVLLACSGCGKTLSIDAKRATGTWAPNVPIKTWPRYLIALQLLWMYFSAGTHKTQSAWWPSGDLRGLYVVLQDPHFARFDLSGLSEGWDSALFSLTQIGTALTMAFELGAPLMGLAIYYRATAHREGRLRSAINTLRVRELWLALGIGFHIALMITIRLGIFPYGMLACYPAFFRPDEVARWIRKMRLSPE